MRYRYKSPLENLINRLWTNQLPSPAGLTLQWALLLPQLLLKSQSGWYLQQNSLYCGESSSGPAQKSWQVPKGRVACPECHGQSVPQEQARALGRDFTDFPAWPSRTADRSAKAICLITPWFKKRNHWLQTSFPGWVSADSQEAIACPCGNANTILCPIAPEPDLQSCHKRPHKHTNKTYSSGGFYWSCKKMCWWLGQRPPDVLWQSLGCSGSQNCVFIM